MNKLSLRERLVPGVISVSFEPLVEPSIVLLPVTTLICDLPVSSSQIHIIYNRANVQTNVCSHLSPLRITLYFLQEKLDFRTS